MPEVSLADPFAEAYAVLNQQWELLSQHLHMLGAGTDSEVFTSLARKTMDMLKPSLNSFSLLPPAIGQAPEANPGISTHLEPVKPETLLATVESLLNKNMVHVENTLVSGNQGLAPPQFKPFSVSSFELTASPAGTEDGFLD